MQTHRHLSRSILPFGHPLRGGLAGKPAGTIKTGLVVGLLCCLRLAASAQPVPAQTLPGHVPAAVTHLAPVGRPEAARELRLTLGLPLRNQAGLTNLLQKLYDPASPEFHHYLTPAQFAESFGPSREDYQSVMAFAGANGLKVTGTHPNRLLLDVSGSVSNIERAFHITLRTYAQSQDKRVFYAPDADPSLDLATPVLHISGLDDYSPPRPRLKALPLAKAPHPTPNAGSGPDGTYLGGDFRAAYAPGLPLTGSGETVGLLEFDGYTTGDITYYESNSSLPKVTLNNVLLDGFDGQPTGDGGEVEVSLDIEVAIAMAPGLSQVMVYEAGPGGDWHDILNRMATDNQARQLSCSWYIGGGGPDPVADQIWEQMAAQGQSFFNASGDEGAYLGPIDFPGDSPYITQVGGTTLTTDGPGGAWVSETVWNWGNGDASGGGVSTYYPIPSWQAGLNMTANGGSTTLRNTPDVALTADNVYVRADGQDDDVGGTSCAAPLWAGFMALVNQQAAANGRPPIGFANPAIYALGREAGYTLGLHDIMTGSNVTPFSLPGKFLAAPGYDLCTGWGTPNGSNLVNALVAPADALLISPGLGFAADGPPGGPFAPTSQNYSLKNTGAGVLNWTLAGLPAWLTASAGGGQLKPAGSAASVSIGLNAAATNLPVGNYAATLWFTNLNDDVGQARQFILRVVNQPVVITGQPTNQAILAGGSAVFSVTATGTGLNYLWQKNGVPLTDGGHLSGSATSTLTVSSAAVADAGVYSVLVSNVLGVISSAGAGLSIYSPGGGQLVQNGGFETGDFSGWTLSGNTNLMLVTTNALAAHSGLHGAQCGPSGSPGHLSQTLPTVPGAAYLISLWLDSPDGAAPNEFSVQWNGNVLYDSADLPALGWTNLQFLVIATGTGTGLQLGLRDDPSYLGLDDVLVTGYTNEASPPAIVVQPASQAVAPGGSATFSVIAVGSTPLGYYWLRNGSPIPGATQSSYTDANVTADAGSQFSCLVSNTYGVLLSSTVVLSVAGPVYVFSGPDGGSALGGLVQTSDGSFYGTTAYGGANGDGTVFQMSTNGALTTLASFNGTDGANPSAGLVQGADGNLYGTTAYGGTYGFGNVFKITTNGVLTSLVSFEYAVNGGYPAAGLVQGADGNLYGTTLEGGSGGGGTVFKMTPNGSLTTLVMFDGTYGAQPNGANPEAVLIQGANGNLYGPTGGGGTDGNGTVFSLTTNGLLTTLVSFNNDNGANPAAGLIQGGNGNLYGTTYWGGAGGYGTVFSLTTNGLLTTLVSFNNDNGANPEAGLILGTDGNLYGTTAAGGAYGAGTLFRLAGDGTLTTIISLAGTNGASPEAALVQGLDGNLYGTTAAGGFGYDGAGSSGDGTVLAFLLAPPLNLAPPAVLAQPLNRIVSAGGTVTFSVQADSATPPGYFWRRNGLPIAGATQSSYTTNDVQLADSGGQFSCLVSNAAGAALSSNAVLTVLPDTVSGPVFSFSGFDGGNTVAGLTPGPNGGFYGTSEYGGTNGGYGTIFAVTTNGVFTTLVSFNYSAGAYPEAGLVPGTDGNLYGTTAGGGYEGWGTVFKMTPNGQVTALADFDLDNGANPQAGLVQGADGSFYGTTAEGGANDGGTVFQITTNGLLTTLVSFNGVNGAYPEAGLVEGVDGNLYGTTSGGGLDYEGTAFKMTTNGLLTTLVSFNFDNGADPQAGLVLGADGNFYGTTANGGAYDNGTIFKLTPQGVLTTLVSFDYDNGAYPEAGLAQGADHKFYGTTTEGGASGDGTVFALSSDGTTLTSLCSFAATNGLAPQAALAQGPDGDFYGVTPFGGAGYDGNSSSGDGVIFRAVVPLVPPAITTQPVSQSVPLGGTASFSVSATGSAPLSYVWQRNGQAIAGATNSSYTTHNVHFSDSGSQFGCLVSNAAGTAASSNAVLTVLLAGSELITFDDLAATTGGVLITNAYDGLTWSNFYVMDAYDYAPASGYKAGMISASNVVFNGYGYPASIAGNAPFNLLSAHLTAAWNQGLQLQTLGYNGSTLLYSNTYTLSATNPALISFNYSGVTEVSFAASGGYPGSPNGDNGSPQFAMDNVSVSAAVIVPTTVVATTNGWNGNSVESFGEPNTATYGQTFVAPAQAPDLLSFTVYLDNLTAPVKFNFEVMAWNGASATGPVLYESPATSTAGQAGWTPYTFTPGGLQLNPGGSYVAFITTSALQDGGYSSAEVGATATEVYTNGSFVYNNNGTDLALLTNSAWTVWSNQDLAFVAVFGGAGIPTLDHFAWSTIASPQGAARPFAVTVMAQDGANDPVSTYAGTAALSGSVGGGVTTSTILGSPAYEDSSSGTWTLGYAFTPNTNITVTQVLSYFGTKVSIWTSGGTLLASQNVANVPGTWAATPLTTPLTLTAGTEYVVGAYTAGTNYYWRTDLADTFPNGTINQSCEIAGDAFPANVDSVRWWFVNLGYTVGSGASIPLTLTNTGPFVNGVWTGSLAVLQDASNAVLTASDGAGHVGSSNPFNVVPGLGITRTNGAFQIAIAGSAGEVYQVMASTNLMNWQTIATVTNLTGTIQFMDPASTNFPLRFYLEVMP